MNISIKKTGVYLLYLFLSNIITMLIYVVLTSIVRNVPADELFDSLSFFSLMFLMLFIQIICAKVLANLLERNKKYFLESIDSSHILGIMRYFIRQDLNKDKNLLLAIMFFLIINLISIGLTAVDNSFGVLAGLCFPMFSSQTIIMYIFGETLMSSIIGVIFSFCLFIVIYYLELAITYKKNRRR